MYYSFVIGTNRPDQRFGSHALKYWIKIKMIGCDLDSLDLWKTQWQDNHFSVQLVIYLTAMISLSVCPIDFTYWNIKSLALRWIRFILTFYLHELVASPFPDKVSFLSAVSCLPLNFDEFLSTVSLIRHYQFLNLFPFSCLKLLAYFLPWSICGQPCIKTITYGGGGGAHRAT